MIKLTRPVHFLFLSLLLTASCSTQDHSPADQLIKEEITISPEWHNITFYKPLQAAPHVQTLELLFCHQQMAFINLRPDEVRTPENSGDFKRTVDNLMFKPEVVVYSGEKEYVLPQASYGVYHSGKAAGCRTIGYGLRGEGMKLILPKGTSFNSAKIRSDASITIDGLYWTASAYERAPNATWENTHPSRIIKIQ